MDELYTKTEEKMTKAVLSLEKEYGAIRAGRANPVILDKVQVEYYGVPTAINQMAAVSVPEPRTVQIQPWDANTLKDIERAILASDLGITPNNDGTSIRLNFPPLNEERRRDLVKDIHKYAEECKVSVRSVRRDILEKYKAQKKEAVITEDDLKNAEKSIQDLTDKFCKEVDKLSASKEKEILEI